MHDEGGSREVEESFSSTEDAHQVAPQARGYKVADEEFTNTCRSEMYIRMVMGFFVNQVYNGILLFTVHTLCFFDGYLNLIKTLFCVALITKVSQEDEPIEIHTTAGEIGKEGDTSR